LAIGPRVATPTSAYIRAATSNGLTSGTVKARVTKAGIEVFAVCSLIAWQTLTCVDVTEAARCAGSTVLAWIVKAGVD